MLDTEPSRALSASTQAATTTAAALPAYKCREVLVQNDAASASTLLVGNSTSQPIGLTAGQSITLPVIDMSLVYVKVASGSATANYLARA